MVSKVRWLRTAIAIVVVAMPLAWAIEWLANLRSYISIEQFIVAELTAALILIFLSPKSGDPGPFDITRAGIAALFGGITLAGIDTFVLQLFFGGWHLTVLSLGLICLAMMGCYRIAGWPMTLLVLTFIVFGAVAKHLPQPFSAPAVSMETYVIYLAFGGDALIGQALKIVSVVVVAFIFFGRMFELIGGTEFFVQIARQVSGAGRGGPIKIAVVTSALFGSISGSTTANVVSSGSFSIPMMTRIGLRPHQAAAVEAVASTGGQLMPPVMGIAAFLMVEIAGLPYREVIAAAALPGLLFFVSVFFQADGLANRMDLPSEKPRPLLLWPFLRTACMVAGPVALLIFTLVRMPFAPGHAAVMGSLACIALALVTQRGLRQLGARVLVLTQLAGEVAARIVVTGAVIGIMLGVVNSTGLGVAAALGIEKMTHGGLALALVAAALASFVLGLGLATTAVYAVVGTLIAPSLINLGLPVISAHLFVFYSAMLSMITPPVAIACLAASGVANASFWQTSVTALRFGWSLFLLPYLFVMNPALLLLDTPLNIVTTAVFCFTGVAALSHVIGRSARDWTDHMQNLATVVASTMALIPVVPTSLRWLAVAVIVGIYVIRRRTNADRKGAASRPT